MLAFPGFSRYNKADRGEAQRVIHIVLVEPEIPQNTGNIARTCAATGSRLHLVEPLGFSLSDRYLKRAGLDYWPLVNVSVHPSLSAAEEALPGIPLYYLSVCGARAYDEIAYPADVALVFGRESRGLPRGLLAENAERCLRIPMIPEARSLNLSNSVAIVCYEALRQRGFPGLQGEGILSESRAEGAWTDYL